MGEDERYNSVIKKFIALDRKHHKLLDRQVTGLHRSQHSMLVYVKKCGHVPTQKELADFFLISPSAVAVTVRKLENAGYLLRESNEKDGRCNGITLTKEGEDVLEKTKKRFDKVDARMFSGFTDEEYRMFSSCLDKMHKNLSEFEKEE